MFSDHEQVWWIVPAGQRVRHAITQRPGSRPDGDVVTALCAEPVKLPYGTWPTSKEPASRKITERCAECTDALSGHPGRDELVVTVWDS